MKVNTVLSALVGFEDGQFWLQLGGSQKRITTKNVGDTLEVNHKIHTIVIDKDGNILSSKSEIPTNGVDSKLWANCKQEEIDESMKSFKDFICSNSIIIFSN